ncbi:CAP domain-containing protein [Geminicoccus roseus]|uniref:CAP domain-containing protein n=1 Tax=Geminicoccus roseus TaxID=404900 RepID=UPI00040DB0D9|nr:CAP domain-containing protein [Geminicoccus roseus]
MGWHVHHARRVLGAMLATATIMILLAGTGMGPAVAASSPDNLPALRERALQVLNADRQEHGLPALSRSESLDAAAQAHAEDMLERDYFAHESPEGEDVRDRYLEQGGSGARLVAENISQCTGCSAPIGQERIDALEEGWMNSPEHRANILKRGLDQFGFGIAVSPDARLYAVQTFSGAGMPLGIGPDEEARQLAPGQRRDAVLEGINAERTERGMAALEPSPVLDEVGEALLPKEGEAFEVAGKNLADVVPADARQGWALLSAASAGCGGCGPAITAADLRWFQDRWLGSAENSEVLLDPDMTHLGFAAVADGNGRKLATLVVGQAR